MTYRIACDHCGAVVPASESRARGPQATYTLCRACADAYDLAEACETNGCPDADDCQCVGHTALREREGSNL